MKQEDTSELALANIVVLVLFFPITEKKEEVKDESEESDDDMGFGKFTFIFIASMISWLNIMGTLALCPVWHVSFIHLFHPKDHCL